MSTVIEFAGIPGSGKSHVSRLLRKRLSLEKIRFTSVDKFIREQAARKVRAALEGDLDIDARIDKLNAGNKKSDIFLRCFASFFRNHHAFVNLYSAILFEREADESVIRSVLLTFMYSCARYAYCVEKRKSVAEEVVIHEEGFAHRLFTLFGYDQTDGETESQVRALAELMPVPFALIWTRCTPTLAVEWMLQRPRKQLPERLEGLERAEVERMLTRGDIVLETGVDVLRRRGAKIVEVRTDLEIGGPELAQTLLRRLDLSAALQPAERSVAK